MPDRASERVTPARAAPSAPLAQRDVVPDASVVDATAPALSPPAALHHMTTPELAALITLAPLADGGVADPRESTYLKWVLVPQPGRFNQGNIALARHTIAKEQCEAGLKDVVIQTPEQRARCGAENMVPIWKGGDPSKATACIDVFEFPNKPCELPMVWGSPSQAARICQMQGKRLCAQEEWNLACGGDPAGGKPSTYAYGDELDLDACNTQRPHDYRPDAINWKCNVQSAQTAWDSCSTDTEPSGAFPRCKSRFGVYDQHGNVAEMMTRKAGPNDPESPSKTVTQLKGSAFFYVDVARQHDRPHPKDAKHDTYPDHCNYDPRWHVEAIEGAMHVNYHLGFRCCKDVR
ncbi:MAG: SUMF1/EgtB/PvdO family nonheme iron enzyme [Polyangiaceae bacterium]